MAEWWINEEGGYICSNCGYFVDDYYDAAVPGKCERCGESMGINENMSVDRNNRLISDFTFVDISDYPKWLIDSLPNVQNMLTTRNRLIELKTKFVDNFDCGDCKPENDKCQKCLIEKETDFLIENRVMLLPLNIGETVFTFHTKESLKIKELKIAIAEIDENNKISYHCKTDEVWERGTFMYIFRVEDIGKRIFLTKEAAEERLNEFKKRNKIIDD